MEIESKIEKVVLTDKYGKFMVEPLERGYGVTLGNALRRVLLSSLPGAAITSVKIEGILHEFSTIPGVLEDVTDIVINLKGLRFKMHTDKPQTLYMRAEGIKEVTGGDIEKNSEVEVLNPEWHIATLTDKKAKLEIEMKVEKGKGYVLAERLKSNSKIGIIPVDGIFSPVQKVNFTVEDTRVGRSTDYNRLILEIWTDGSIPPDNALSFAAHILIEQLSLFQQLGRPLDKEEPPVIEEGEVYPSKGQLLNTSIEEMDFGVRTYRCFKKSKIEKLGDIVNKTESELMNIRNFGKTSLKEVKEKLAKLGLSLKEEI